MHQQSPEDQQEQRRLAALAESALAFRRVGMDAFDHLFVKMVGDNAALDGFKFSTPNGRNAMICLAFGDDSVGMLTDAINNVIDAEGTEGPEAPEGWKQD